VVGSAVIPAPHVVAAAWPENAQPSQAAGPGVAYAAPNVVQHRIVAAGKTMLTAQTLNDVPNC
jgi:hypothetical protein